jgi:hypothetical protein
MDSAPSEHFKRSNPSRRGIISCDESDFCRERQDCVFPKKPIDCLELPIGWIKQAELKRFRSYRNRTRWEPSPVRTAWCGGVHAYPCGERAIIYGEIRWHPATHCALYLGRASPTCQLPRRAFRRGYQNHTFSLRACAREPRLPPIARHDGQAHDLENRARSRVKLRVRSCILVSWRCQPQYPHGLPLETEGREHAASSPGRLAQLKSLGPC